MPSVRNVAHGILLAAAAAAAACAAAPALAPPPGAAAPAASPAELDFPRPSARPRAAGSVRGPAQRVPGSPRLFLDTQRDTAEDGPLRIHFVDVGQGDATIFELPCGLVLADTGGESIGDFSSTERLAAYLDELFDRRTDLARTIDLLILTHQHIDHTRGAERMRSDFTLRRVADNGQDRQSSGSAQQNALRQWALDNGVEYLPIRAAEIELVDPEENHMGSAHVAPLTPIAPCGPSPLAVEITFLWGDAGTTAGEFSNANNSSVAFRVDWGDASALLTGDLEQAGIERLIEKYGGATELLDADVFQVGHHGSHNATTEDLVDLITPKLAVFSAGDPARREGTFNAFRFAHPNHKALRILDDPWRGVACGRDPVDVPVGIKGASPSKPPVWELWTLESGLFSTGWDGDVVVEALSNGNLAITTREQGDQTGLACP
ncbi:MAG TPA: MBL fold metallo-hydrolase [Thermoanaerobaculia bacterium]